MIFLCRDIPLRHPRVNGHILRIYSAYQDLLVKLTKGRTAGKVLDSTARRRHLDFYQNLVESPAVLKITERLFCECCGMRLRASPANQEYKEKVRAKKDELSSHIQG
jgi:hypothetical protein